VVRLCFGHQLLYQLLGDDARAAKKGWGGGIHRHTATKVAKRTSPPAAEVADVPPHMGQVTTLPPDTVVLTQSTFFFTNAVLKHGPNVITIQPPKRGGVFGPTYPMWSDLYADGQADQVLTNLEKKTNKNQVDRWLVKFFQDRINRADT
jgi:hypothetical protein